MLKIKVKLLTKDNNVKFNTTIDCLNDIAQANKDKVFPLSIVDNNQKVEINFANIDNIRVEDDVLIGDMNIYVYPAILGSPKQVLNVPDGKPIVTEYQLKDIILIDRSSNRA